MPLGAPPPDRDLPPVSTEPSANVVAFGRTTACPWGVDLYPRGTRATRTRLHVVGPPGVEKVSRHAVIPHRELLAPADRTLLRGVRPTTPARTTQDLFHADPGWPDPRAAVQHDSTTHHWSRHERARDRLRHRAMADTGRLVASIGVHDLRRRPTRLMRRLREALLERGWDPPRVERERTRWTIRRVETLPPRPVGEAGS